MRESDNFQDLIEHEDEAVQRERARERFLCACGHDHPTHDRNVGDCFACNCERFNPAPVVMP